MKQFLWLLLLLVSGCASNSGVVPVGEDTYKIYKRGATGFSGSEAVKSDVLIQASEYCATKKRFLHVTNVILGKPPYILGNFPKAEVQFKCLDAKESKVANESEVGMQPKDDIYDELKKLKGLLDDGTLTQKEFDERKKKILSK